MDKGEEFAEKILRRRGTITAFDVHRLAKPPKTIGGRRLWWIITSLSLVAGLMPGPISPAAPRGTAS